MPAPKKPRAVSGWARFKTGSKSFNQDCQKGQVNELQAGMAPALAALPQPPVFLQAGKAAFHYPALGPPLAGLPAWDLSSAHAFQQRLDGFELFPTDVAWGNAFSYARKTLITFQEGRHEPQHAFHRLARMDLSQ